MLYLTSLSPVRDGDIGDDPREWEVVPPIEEPRPVEVPVEPERVPA